MHVREAITSQEVKVKKTDAILDPRSDPKVNQMRSQVEALCARKVSIQVSNQKTYDAAVQERKELQEMLVNIDEFFEPARVASYNAYKAILNTKASLHDPVEAAIKKRTQDIVNWELECEKLRQQEEQRLLEESTKEAQKKREAEIKKAKRRGDTDAVERLQDAPLEVEEVEVEEAYEKNKDVSRRKTYKGEVTDLYQLIKFVAKNKHFIHLLSPNMSAINTLAKNQKDTMSIPGLKAIPIYGLATIRRDDDD